MTTPDSGRHVIQLLVCLRLAACACRLRWAARLPAPLLASWQPQAANSRHLSPCSFTSRMLSFRCAPGVWLHLCCAPLLQLEILRPACPPACNLQGERAMSMMPCGLLRRCCTACVAWSPMVQHCSAALPAATPDSSLCRACTQDSCLLARWALCWSSLPKLHQQASGTGVQHCDCARREATTVSTRVATCD